MLNQEAKQIADAWITAGRNLGIDVISPYILHRNGQPDVEFVALVPQFGSKKGMLLLATIDWSLMELATENGFGYSCLNVESYGNYVRGHFIDTLNDWGWSP